MTVGIDAIALAVPHGYVDLSELAAARGVDPAKYTAGLDVHQMAVAAAHEDPVALAANAARRVFEVSGRSPDDIGLCVVGTETAVDHSKPIAAFVHRLAGLPAACRVYETKHACYGGTAGVLTAADWIASGSARGRSALVVCTDIARYAVGSAGEPTQGAGAVALLVTSSPRLVELELGSSGSYARDVHDFWRPLWSKEALVDGHYSVQCYLDALAGAYGEWRAATDDHELARRCYHVPYGKMARKAHRSLAALDGRAVEDADASFATEVDPSLVLPRQVGNIYTGSLYLALASLLHGQAGELEGRRIGLFSYGSGCTAEFFSARVASGAGAAAAAQAIAAPLEARGRLSIAEYEAIRGADDDLDRASVGAFQTPAGSVAYQGIDQDRRVYSVP